VSALSPHSPSRATSRWAVVFAILMISGDVALAEEGVHWSYEGDLGPEHWAELSPDFVLCRHGVNQSPLDIVETVEAELSPIRLDYRGRTTKVVNNGHTLQVDVDAGNWLRVDGEDFELLQFHFHSPSEHHIRSESFPLEAHFVHRNARGQLAVMAVMFRLGEEHVDLRRIGAIASRQVGESLSIDIDLAKLSIHSEHAAYFRYNGSLTTPPCSEGIRWYVLKVASHISQEQVDSFVELIGEDARGPQPPNARLVLEH